jgi:hypothetical protein
MRASRGREGARCNGIVSTGMKIYFWKSFTDFSLKVEYIKPISLITNSKNGKFDLK